MSSITLDGVWMNTVADPSDACFLPLAALELAPVVNVAVRQYATGFRAVTTPGKQKTAKVTTSIVTTAQQQWIDDHMGVVVWFREGTGTKFAGLFTDPTFSPYWGFDGWAAVALTVQQVTVSDLL